MYNQARLDRYDQSAYSIKTAGGLRRQPPTEHAFYDPEVLPQVVANETGDITSIQSSFYTPVSTLNQFYRLNK